MNKGNNVLFYVVVICAFLLLGTAMCRACYISGQRSVNATRTETSVMVDYIIDVIMETDYYEVLLEDEELNDYAELFGEDSPEYMLRLIIRYTEMSTADEIKESAE